MPVRSINLLFASHYIVPVLREVHQCVREHFTFLTMVFIAKFQRSSCMNVVPVVSSASSGNSSVYLWTSARSVGHAYIFEVLDSAHFQHQLYNFTQPSTALQRRVNTLLNFYCKCPKALQRRATTLLNFYCNVYDVAAADERRCCTVRCRP